MLDLSRSIKSITFNNAVIKMSQYVDDTALIVDDGGQSLIAALSTLSALCGIS